MVHFIPSNRRTLALMAAQAEWAPVLIVGAQGTGKSAVARWIHHHSIHQLGPCKVVHAAAAHQPNHESLIEALISAEGGTLIIADIGEWPLGDQKFLLHYLKTSTIETESHEGSTAAKVRRLLRTRVIATTSQVLELRARGGLFNGELLQRLSAYRIEMPALIERREEFQDIVEGILAEITRDQNREHLREFSPEAWEKLRIHTWPGNLRELRNVLRLAVTRAQANPIEARDLEDLSDHRVDLRATREAFERVYLAELIRTTPDSPQPGTKKTPSQS
jgi:DNA-binding NtrC family response regulator